MMRVAHVVARMRAAGEASPAARCCSQALEVALVSAGKPTQQRAVFSISAHGRFELSKVDTHRDVAKFNVTRRFVGAKVGCRCIRYF